MKSSNKKNSLLKTQILEIVLKNVLGKDPKLRKTLVKNLQSFLSIDFCKSLFNQSKSFKVTNLKPNSMVLFFEQIDKFDSDNMNSSLKDWLTLLKSRLKLWFKKQVNEVQVDELSSNQLLNKRSDFS